MLTTYSSINAKPLPNTAKYNYAISYGIENAPMNISLNSKVVTLSSITCSALAPCKITIKEQLPYGTVTITTIRAPSEVCEEFKRIIEALQLISF